MVDRYVVRARIAKIREYVALLRKIRRLTEERRFVKDPLVYGNAERYLQLAIQSVLNISNHIVADMNLALAATSQSCSMFSPRTKSCRPHSPGSSCQWPGSETCSSTSILRSIDAACGAF